jgi:hypothetical protein
MSRLSISKKQIIIAVVLIIFVYLITDLNTRLTVLTQQNEQLDRIQLEVTNFKKTEFYVNTQIAYASSDAGVESYIRVYGSAIKPGDVPIIPLSARNITRTPAVRPTSQAEHVENWVIWRVLILGK